MTDNATNFEVRERRMKEIRLGEALISMRTSVYMTEDAAEAFAKYEADMRELADICTLDEADPNWSNALSPDGGFYCLVPRFGGALAFDGATPPKARAEAAAWVRAKLTCPTCNAVGNCPDCNSWTI